MRDAFTRKVVGVFRDKQHGQSRVARLNLKGELQAGKVGESKVQDYEAGVGEREDFRGLMGGCRRNRAVPCIFQDLTDMATDAWFVIDNEDECHTTKVHAADG